MKTYRLTVNFETIYTKEVSNKVEYTNDFYAARGAYIVYIENPEVTFCSLDEVGANGMPKKIIAVYNPK